MSKKPEAAHPATVALQTRLEQLAEGRRDDPVLVLKLEALLLEFGLRIDIADGKYDAAEAYSTARGKQGTLKASGGNARRVAYEQMAAIMKVFMDGLDGKVAPPPAEAPATPPVMDELFHRLAELTHDLKGHLNGPQGQDGALAGYELDRQAVRARLLSIVLGRKALLLPAPHAVYGEGGLGTYSGSQDKTSGGTLRATDRVGDYFDNPPLRQIHV